MYTVELIPKESTNKDIIIPWVKSGRKDNSDDGAYVFTDVIEAVCEHGAIVIMKGNNIYYYNLSDFYRVKVTKNA